MPAEFRQLDHIQPGQEFDVERLDRGDYRLVRRTVLRNEGAVDWLLACPRRGFFVPIDSESTDSLSGMRPESTTHCEVPGGRQRTERADETIAATALAHDLAIATRNRADFASAGVRVVDPFAG